MSPLKNLRFWLKLPPCRDSVVVMTDAKGLFYFNIRKGNKYPLLGTKANYLTQVTTVDVPKTAGDTVKVTLVFDRIQTNIAINIENIYFDLDKWDIRADAA